MSEFVKSFRALADSTRQRMLALLEESGSLCVSELGVHFEMAQPSISHHLRILKEAGLVTARKRGKEVYYAINHDELSRCCGGFFDKFACCRAILRAKPARASKGGAQ
jgi:DNA-binding transcriptional ArsR family regulator